jgi:hypothetical protein
MKRLYFETYPIRVVDVNSKSPSRYQCKKRLKPTRDERQSLQVTIHRLVGSNISMLVTIGKFSCLTNINNRLKHNQVLIGNQLLIVADVTNLK